MARKKRSPVKTAAVIAAIALAEKAIQKAAKDPRVRRKAKALGRALKKRAKATGKKISKAIRKRAPKVRRAVKRKARSRA
ncbi:MAG: hypothetical protein ABI703_01250 [Gemmatimonadales bacterium]